VYEESETFAYYRPARETRNPLFSALGRMPAGPAHIMRSSSMAEGRLVLSSILMLLSSIVAVTLVVPDPDAVAQAYVDTLEYRVVESGQVSESVAGTWAMAPLAGRRVVLVLPKSGELVYLRLVKDASTERPALRTLGWNATEILVEDPPALERRLADSRFRVIGPPAPLDMNPAVVAMQALGPAGELFYFTRIPPGQSKFNLGSARSFVDRVFIVVLGVHDIRRTLDFYSETFGLPVTAPAPSRVAVLAQAWGMPADQAFPLAIVRLPERFLIEVDEYPAAAEPASPGETGLPGGMAMVSFSVPALEPFESRLLAAPRRLDDVPYAGRRVGILRGPSGELIELIESPPVPASP
jgi:catechol 2,3-dioxygenase-like lactoylglutathione lyase family enzyme